jgi:lysine 2,3-aminomutase
MIGQSASKVFLRNYEGVIAAYAETQNYKESCDCAVCKGEEAAAAVGIAGLNEGHGISLEPKDLRRSKRRGFRAPGNGEANGK